MFDAGSVCASAAVMRSGCGALVLLLLPVSVQADCGDVVSQHSCSSPEHGFWCQRSLHGSTSLLGRPSSIAHATLHMSGAMLCQGMSIACSSRQQSQGNDTTRQLARQPPSYALTGQSSMHAMHV